MIPCSRAAMITHWRVWRLPFTYILMVFVSQYLLYRFITFRA